MVTETIEVLQKTPLKKATKTPSATTGCCGGAPTSNEDACCRLDEEKKAEGESGCGCNTTAEKSSGTGCC